MVYFCAVDGEVVLDLALLPFNLFFKNIDVLLLVADQEHQIFRENIRMFLHHLL